MPSWSIMTIAVDREIDIVPVRQRARRIAELLGYDTQDQTRIATAVSEIAREIAHSRSRGKVEFGLDGRRGPENFVIRLIELPGGEAAKPGAAVATGRVGASRLMDRFTSDEIDGGVVHTMIKALPRHRATEPSMLADISRCLAGEMAGDALSEVRAQNQELLHSLEQLEAKREEAVRLSEELERTNKGVVALYAELDRRAMELQRLNDTLEQRVITAVAERQAMEEDLRQSQKMEAVGQLTGGIAHDFNNLLMIIGGSLELLRRRVPKDENITRLINNASQGVERGGRLNQQLLAFARRQDLREEVFSIEDLAPSIEALIERAVTEAVKIEVELAPDLWTCRADPHQLETALLNLSINAGDAMPDGGTLTFSAENRRVTAEEAARWEGNAGDYVVAAVADTGTGIAPDMLKRVFEPFFTTKETGRGTGLGLSQVYGFAKQSGGFVALESTLGLGTRVMIHLPAVDPQVPEDRMDAPVAGPKSIPGSARILVVEDDPGVRGVATAMLSDLGYMVTEVGTADSALRLLENEPIDLVFSDVVLPDGVSGYELCERVNQRWPELPVLLTSGYTADRLAPAHSAFNMLNKPYDEAELSQAVRQLLPDQH